MKVNTSIITQYTDVALPASELVETVNRKLGIVESSVDVAGHYAGAVIVRVVSATPHPDANRLRVVMIDDAGVVADVPRDEAGLVQVVCGAPNARADIYALWLPPGVVVPATRESDEPLTLSARPLRGVVSHGMLAAADELAIGTDHDGIIELTEADLPPRGEASRPLADLVGASMSEVFGLDGTTIDIENKMFTHRPDLFGQLGVARELAGITGRQFVSPDWYAQPPTFASVDAPLALTVRNDAPDQVARIMAVAFDVDASRPSPVWLQAALAALGAKSISLVVDITNYVMLMTAQPIHAYDYDTLHGAQLIARRAADGEAATLLDGTSRTLHADDLVIADQDGVVGMAGVMGGGESEVSSATRRVVIEVASFDMYTIRRTSMRHGLFTEATVRFTKGQPPAAADRVMAYVISLMRDVAAATQVSDVVDERASERADAIVIETTSSFVNARLGTTLEATEMASLLRHVECDVQIDGDTLAVTVPFWRTDLELAEDIVEEVGRLHGYDRLPRTLPTRDMAPIPVSPARALARTLRQALARAGAHDVLTYSFVHERLITQARQDASDAYRLSNALSPDIQLYRLSLTPSLLDKVYHNIRAGHDEFALFEIGTVHSKSRGYDDEDLPLEPRRLGLVYAAKKPAAERSGAAFFVAKRLLGYATETLGLDCDVTPLIGDESSLDEALIAPFVPARSAVVRERASGRVIGIVGEYAPSVQRALKLPSASAGFELLLDEIESLAAAAPSRYQPLSRFPSIERDICFELDRTTTYRALSHAVLAELETLDIPSRLAPVDLHVVSETRRRITLRITLSPQESTLTRERTSQLLDTIAETVAGALTADIV